MPYDPAKYAFTRTEPVWMHMDIRHILGVFHFVMSHPFRNVLEIGSHDGSSSSALVEALNQKGDFHLTLCDPALSPSLAAVIALAEYPDRVTMRRERSMDVISGAFDLVVVDGDHSFRYMKHEIELLRRAGVPTLIAHDTSFILSVGCDGPCHLKHVYQSDPRFHCVEDERARPGEMTDRGLFFASRDPDVIRGCFPGLADAIEGGAVLAHTGGS